jgi:hypothetical protein
MWLPSRDELREADEPEIESSGPREGMHPVRGQGTVLLD